MSAIHRHLAEKGYYVFPVEVVREYLKKKNIKSMDDLYQKPTDQIASYFGADVVLYTDFILLDAQYIIFSTHTVVKFMVKMVSA